MSACLSAKRTVLKIWWQICLFFAVLKFEFVTSDIGSSHSPRICLRLQPPIFIV